MFQVKFGTKTVPLSGSLNLSYKHFRSYSFLHNCQCFLIYYHQLFLLAFFNLIWIFSYLRSSSIYLLTLLYLLTSRSFFSFLQYICFVLGAAFFMDPDLVWFCNHYRRILDKQITLQMINMHVMPIVCTSYVWSIAACRLSSISPLSGLQLKILHVSLWCKCFFIVCYFLYFWIIICLFLLALFYMSMKLSICGIAYWLQKNFT